MLSSIVENEKVPFVRSKSILTLCGNIWLKETILQIDKKDKKRLKRYTRIEPYHLAVEQPVIFKEDAFLSCLEDRLHGTLLIDKKIKYLEFQDFLDNSTRMEGYDEIEPPDSIFKEISENGLDYTKYDLLTIASNKENLSDKSMYWLTKDSNDSWVILYDCSEDLLNFDDLVKMIFREYDFEDITFNLYEESDSEYPTYESVNNNVFDCGSLTLKDSILKKGSIDFKFFNINLIYNILNKK